jgi:hypothetical protein
VQEAADQSAAFSRGVDCAISNGVDRLPDRVPNVLLDPERAKENDPSTGGEPGPSFIGCHGGITPGLPSPSNSGNIGSKHTVLIYQSGCPN